ncbi:MAG: 3-phosphoshikimate 1-carboxyvinyltransferase [Chlamydiota bacterium]
MRCRIEPSALNGSISVPPSKSQTLRALLFGLMGRGKTLIHNPLRSPDTQAMIKAIQHLGAKVALLKRASEKYTLEVEGVAGKLQMAEDVIDAGNSGLVLRLIGALAGLLPSYTVITGDHSIRHRRPAAPLLEGLTQLGAFATSARLDHYAPLIIRGPIKKGTARIDGADSQPVSGLLIASTFAAHQTEIYVDHPGETPWIDLTLHWLDTLHLPYQRRDYHHYSVSGCGRYDGFCYTVPADLSSCSYPLAAALVTKSSLTLTSIDTNDNQGDKALFSILQDMGAKIKTDQTTQSLTVAHSPDLKGMAIDVNPIIDALPLLAVIGCYAQGKTTLYNGHIARHKESDRIRCIVKELKKMKADIIETADGMTIRRSVLRGAALKSHSDHRIAMALSIAALFAKGPSTLEGIECMAKTYPHFIKHFRQLGAKVTLL